MSSDSIFPSSWGLDNNFTNFKEAQGNVDIPGFPSASLSGQYGVTLRGMTFVSALAEFKLTGLSVKDIAGRYFPDSNLQTNTNGMVYSDVNSKFEGITSSSRRFLYTDTNEFAFTVYVFYSKDAIKLAEAHECLKTGKQEVVFFIEDNTGDSSEQYAAVKISEDVKANAKIGIEALKNSSAVGNYVHDSFPGLSSSQIDEVLQTGSLEYKNTALLAAYIKAMDVITYLTPLGPIIAGIREGAPYLSKIFGEIANFINRAKIDDHNWNPKAQKLDEDGKADSSYTPEKDFSPFFFPGAENLETEKENGADNYLGDGIKGLRALLVNQDKDVRSFLSIEGSVNTKETDSLQYYFYSKYKALAKVFDTALDAAENFKFEGGPREAVYAINAFLCGLWNGLVDAVSGLFLLVKMIFDLFVVNKEFMANIDKELPVLLEHIDNLIQAFEAIDTAKIWAGIKDKFSELLDTDIDLIPLAYFVGAVYGFIVSLIIEIVIGILVSGGTLSVAAVAEKLSEMFASLFRAGASLAKGIVRGVYKVTTKALKALYQVLIEITSLLRKGTDEILRIIDEVFAAIRKNDNLIDDTGALSAGIAEGAGASNYTVLKKSLDKIGRFRNVLKFENEIRLQKFESAKFFNSKGKELTINLSQGNSKSVEFSEHFIDELRIQNADDLVLTHNHPLNSSISFEDIKMFIDNNLKELRAVTPEGKTFALQRKSKLPSPQEFENEIRPKAMQKFRKKNAKKIESATAIENKSSREFMDANNQLKSLYTDELINELKQVIKYIKYE